MAHNIHFDERTGQAAFYSLEKKAWHGYGQISDKPLSSKEVLIEAQLAYPVEKSPYTYKLPSGREIVSEDAFFTFRTDTEVILGKNLSAGYHVVQNVDAFSFFDSIVAGEGIRYETAGALGRGQSIFITAKLPSYIKVSEKDLIEQYLFLTTSHDGSSSIQVAFTPVRIVCNNTLNAALGNCSNVVRIRHTASAEEQLKEAHKIMGMVNTLSPLMEQSFQHWSKIKVKDSEVQRLIQLALAPNQETINCIRDGRYSETSKSFKNQAYSAFGYAMSADSQQMDTTKGTLFGAYNAVTGYFQNVRSYDDQEEKMTSLLYGGTAQKKGQAAFEICTAFAKSGADALLLN